MNGCMYSKRERAARVWAWQIERLSGHYKVLCVKGKNALRVRAMKAKCMHALNH